MTTENSSRNYEAIFIFQDIAEEEIQKFKDQLISDFEKRNVTVVSNEDWGLRPLFHETNHHTRGKFYYYTISAPPQAMQQITNDINVNAGIIKSMVTRIQ